MKRLNLDEHIKKHSHYATLAWVELSVIDREIKMYVDWNDNISIEDVPGDGLCVSDGNEGLVPLDKVIEIINKEGTLSEHDYNLNKI